MIIGINVLKTLTKHISCKCKCKFDEKKCNSNQWWNNDKCWCECKNSYVKKIMNPATCNRKNGQSLASIMDDSAIRCNEILESYGEGTNFNEKKVEFYLPVY